MVGLVRQALAIFKSWGEIRVIVWENDFISWLQSSLRSEREEVQQQQNNFSRSRGRLVERKRKTKAREGGRNKGIVGKVCIRLLWVE